MSSQANVSASPQGKVVVVTGAGSGIGRAIALGFARDGARVLGFGRTTKDLEAVAAAAPQGSFTVVPGDVAKLADLRGLVETAERAHGRIDILCNNAAIYPKELFLEMSPEDWAVAVHVNVIGMAQLCRLVLPGMLARGHGRVLNVGSYAWRGPIPRASGYSTTKAAVSVLSKSIALEIDRQRYPDVLVNEFIPGVYQTRMSDQGGDAAEVYPHARHVALLPAGSPSGAIYERSQLVVERRSLLGRVRGALGRALRGKPSGG